MKPPARKFPGAGFVIFVRNVYLYPAKIKKNMTKLSVNINKIATLRNSRGGDIPNVVEAALNAERFGAQGITVHPVSYTHLDVYKRQGEGDIIEKLETQYRRDERVIRFLTFKMDKYAVEYAEKRRNKNTAKDVYKRQE